MKYANSPHKVRSVRYLHARAISLKFQHCIRQGKQSASSVSVCVELQMLLFGFSFLLRRKTKTNRPKCKRNQVSLLNYVRQLKQRDNHHRIY